MHLHDLGTAPRRDTSVLDAARLEQDAQAPLLARAGAPADPAELPALELGSQEADPFRNLLLWWHGEQARRTGPVVVTALATRGVDQAVVGATEAWWAANLAIALAGTGTTTLLIDARLADPGAEHRAGNGGGNALDDRAGHDVPATAGLHEVLLGTPLADAVSPGPAPGLSVMPPGQVSDPPAQRLLTERFAAVAHEAAARFEAVVVVAPALDRGDDARVMAGEGSLLLSMPAGRGARAALRSRVAQLHAGGSRVDGVLVAERRRGRVRA